MATYRKVASGWKVEICVNGLRKSKTKPTKAEAKSWAAEMEFQLGQQSEGVSTTHTLNDVFERYANEISESKKGAHWEIVRLKKFSRDPIAKIKLIDLRREHFDDFIVRSLKTIKSSSVNRELNLISHCLTEARRWRLMDHEPFTDLKRPKNPPPRDRRISPHEQQAILISLGYSELGNVITQQQRIGVAFLFALETAMRAGEICGLPPEHIDTVNKTVHLPDTKNGFARDVPLSTEALRLLKRLEPWVPGEAVFNLSSEVLSSLFRRAVISANITDLTFHDSRHEATTRLAAKLDTLDLARVTGHRDIKQLMIYYNKTAAELAKQLN